MILIDATSLQSSHRHRAVGLYLRQLIDAIEERGDVRPHYLVSHFGAREVTHLPRERVTYVPRPHWPAGSYWAYNGAAFALALQRMKPQAFLAPDPDGLVLNPHGRTVAVLHDLIVLKDGASPTRGKAARLARDLRLSVYLRDLARVDGIIAVNDSIRADAVNLLNLPVERLHVVQHGVDRRRFPPTLGEGPFAMRGRYLLNVGGRDFTKNQARIVAAFAKAVASTGDRATMLYFAGPWQEADRRWLREIARNHGVTERARHLGYVPTGDLPSLYGNALGLVFTSLEEGFGLPMLEAMSCGAPVLTSDRPTLREVVGSAALLADPMSVESIAEGIGRLMADEPLRDDLRRRGFEHVRSFSWDRTAQRTLAILGPGEEA